MAENENVKPHRVAFIGGRGAVTGGGGGGASTFLDLTDTPGNYSGFPGAPVRVTQGENGLEFGPALTLGAGFNVLMVVDNGGTIEMQWVDIQDIIIALTGAVNRIIRPPDLIIPAPLITDMVAEDDAGDGGQDEVVGISAPVPGIMESATENTSGTDDVDDNLSPPVPTIMPTVQIT